MSELNRPDWKLFIDGIGEKTVKCTCGQKLTGISSISEHYQYGHFDYGHGISIHSYTDFAGAIQFITIVQPDPERELDHARYHINLARHTLFKLRNTLMISPDIPNHILLQQVYEYFVQFPPTPKENETWHFNP